MTYHQLATHLTIFEVLESLILDQCMKEMPKNYSLEEKEVALPPLVANTPVQKMDKQNLNDYLARIV